MASAAAIQKANRVKERMLAAERALREFIERPDRRFTADELRQHRKLADRLSEAISEYMEAMKNAR